MNLKLFAGLLVVLASIVYANVAFYPQDNKPANSLTAGLQLVAQQPRCPEDSVRLLVNYPHDKGLCVPADDLPEGQARDAALNMTATCQPVGTVVVSIEDGEVLGWCNQGGNT